MIDGFVVYPCTSDFWYLTGRFTVVLLFMERNATKPGSRVFSITIQGKVVEANFDILTRVRTRLTTLAVTYGDIEVRMRGRVVLLPMRNGYEKLGRYCFTSCMAWPYAMATTHDHST